MEFGIDQETLTAGTLAKGVRKAGAAIGDGIEIVADKAKGVYNKVSSTQMFIIKFIINTRTRFDAHRFQ